FAMNRDCKVVRVAAAGHSPVGYCRRPVMTGAMIYYVLPLTNVSHNGKGKTVSKSVERLYYELFREELVIYSKRRFMQQLQDQAEISNLKLREKIAATPKLPTPKEPKRGLTPQYHYRLGSHFNALKDLDGFAAAVGKPAAGKQGTTMADYCPLV
ncbi:hypothetical protein ADUPG1_003485, partial [Aduncisulcus paluster]